MAKATERNVCTPVLWKLNSSVIWYSDNDTSVIRGPVTKQTGWLKCQWSGTSPLPDVYAPLAGSRGRICETFNHIDPGTAGYVFAHPAVSVFYVSQFILYPNIHFDTYRRTFLWTSWTPRCASRRSTRRWSWPLRWSSPSELSAVPGAQRHQHDKQHLYTSGFLQ